MCPFYEETLAQKVAKQNIDRLEKEMKEINSEDGINTGKVWKMKKKFCPRAYVYRHPDVNSPIGQWIQI